MQAPPRRSAHGAKKDSFVDVLRAQAAQSPYSRFGAAGHHLNSEKLLVNPSASWEVGFFFVTSPGRQDSLVLEGLEMMATDDMGALGRW